jgi:hypothetical protein
MVESIRRRYLDQAIGKMTKRATWAVDKLTKLGDDAQSESVQLRAARAILSDMMAVSKYSALETRMGEIERKLREHDIVTYTPPPMAAAIPITHVGPPK